MAEKVPAKSLIKSKTETALLIIDMQMYQAGEGGTCRATSAWLMVRMQNKAQYAGGRK